MKACGLSVCPTYQVDAPLIGRLKTISNDIKGRIATMGNLFVFEGLVESLYIIAIDSTLLKSKGHVWHVSSMKEGVVSPLFRN